MKKIIRLPSSMRLVAISNNKSCNTTGINYQIKEKCQSEKENVNIVYAQQK